ncbi:MAG TPA: biotin--[acetyl-CoA-carboxylase] ligase, partial [Methylomirabilota bacterium]|nr:biotin--[acetyl-CoA-carboxylase] ligase [Methylomirabilota bacterium]
PTEDPAPDPALAAALGTALPGPPLTGPLLAFASLPSTQIWCRTLAARGAAEGLVVVADHQTAGRGQRGRRWVAPPGTALLLSCLLRPDVPTARWGELPLVAGVAVAEALEAAAGAPTRLRWPNDVLVAGRKVAGILAEGVPGRHAHVVLGIGVNVDQTAADWPAELAGHAASLRALGHPVRRPALLATLLATLAARYTEWRRMGFGPARAGWRQRALLGHRMATGGGAGVAVDLGPRGALVLRRDDGTVVTVVAAGES